LSLRCFDLVDLISVGRWVDCPHCNK